MSSPIAVCLCTRIFPSVGGIETLAEKLATEWTAAGHRVVVVSDVQDDGRIRPGFPFPVLYRPSAKRFLHEVRHCDLFVHNNISLKAIWPLLLVRRPFVAVHHSFYQLNCERQSIRERCKLQIARRWGFNVSVSRAVQRLTNLGGVVIPNPYDDVTFRVLSEARTRELVFVGRLVSEKGVDVLLKALRRLQSCGRFPTLSVIGDGPERRRLEGMVEEFGLQKQVEFLGIRRGNELATILNRHVILVVPSLCEETFGIVALEGAACGCIVVGSCGGGLADAIGPCGVTFPRGDDQSLAEILENLLAKPEKWTLFRAAAAEHLARHKAQVISAKYIDCFRIAMAEFRERRCAS